MPQSRFILSFVCGVAAAAFAVPAARLAAEDPLAPVSVDKQWEQAKQAYQGKITAIRDDVFIRLHLAEDKARNEGDSRRVRALRQELADFEATQQLPSVVDELEYSRTLRAAQDDLRKAFKPVLVAYLKDRLDDESEQLERELADLLGAIKLAGIPAIHETPADVKPSEPAVVASKAVAGGKAASPVWTRWVNTSYDSVLVPGKGKEWMEINNKTGKVQIQYTEVARTPDCLELFCAARGHKVRFLAKKAELFRNGQWIWVATGHWEGGYGK